MKAKQFIAQFRIFSREGQIKVASNSEIQRWCQAGNVLINSEKVDWDEDMDFPIFSVIVFPRGKRVTLL
jgi:hypothetical protein